MVLTAAQTTAFFENADQMGVQHAMVVQLAQEGIQSIDDLADFDKEALQQLADNLQCPGGKSPPVETAEFAKSRGIDDEAAFIWWVPHTLRKRNAIILAMKMRLQKTTHKYGIEIPTSVEHAMEINQKNGNTMWRDALALEMFNVGVAFEILEEDQPAPAGWKKASRHLIWDVKMDFTRKARWVLLKNSSSLFSGSPTLRGSSVLLTLLVSFLKITCLHVSFTAYENFYKLYLKNIVFSS